MVIRTIKDMDAQRRCFRLVGGVLVERTVGEVLPAVQKNHDGVRARVRCVRGERVRAGDGNACFVCVQIRAAVEKLTEQLRAKQQEVNEFRAQHQLNQLPEKGARARALGRGLRVRTAVLQPIVQRRPRSRAKGRAEEAFL